MKAYVGVDLVDVQQVVAEEHCCEAIQRRRSHFGHVQRLEIVR